MVLGLELTASSMLGKYSIAKLHPQPHFGFPTNSLEFLFVVIVDRSSLSRFSLSCFLEKSNQIPTFGLKINKEFGGDIFLMDIQEVLSQKEHQVRHDCC